MVATQRDHLLEPIRSLQNRPSVAVIAQKGQQYEIKYVLDDEQNQHVRFPNVDHSACSHGDASPHYGSTLAKTFALAPTLLSMPKLRLQALAKIMQKHHIQTAVLNAAMGQTAKLIIPESFRPAFISKLMEIFPDATLTPCLSSMVDHASIELFLPQIRPGLVESDRERTSSIFFTVKIEFWETLNSKEALGERLESPTRQDVVTTISHEAWMFAQGSDSAVLPFRNMPHLLQAVEPIDVVYTWVDDSDVEWIQSRDLAIASQETHCDQSATDVSEAKSPARFQSHNELLYSLRSLEMFAPWVRNIFLVTAGQVPEWLKLDHPKLTVINHNEIFLNPEDLPVFNSHAIESQLHRIPGLSDRYLYMNDDIFFGRELSPETFFHGNGIAKFFPSDALINLSEQGQVSAFTAAALNSQQFIRETFAKETTQLFKHAPHPQLRSVLFSLEEQHPEIFSETSSSKFRELSDYSIAASLHHYYAYALGKAVPADIEYLYLDLANPHAQQWFDLLLQERKFDVFCINDTPMSQEQREKSIPQFQNFLNTYFPHPSSFEKSLDLPILHD